MLRECKASIINEQHILAPLSSLTNAGKLAMTRSMKSSIGVNIDVVKGVDSLEPLYLLPEFQLGTSVFLSYGLKDIQQVLVLAIIFKHFSNERSVCNFSTTATLVN